MTKAEAIIKLMYDYGGVVTLRMIYNEIDKYYPDARKSKEWEAGIRGVINRDLGKRFKRLGTSLYAPMDYLVDNGLKNGDNLVTEREVLSKIRTVQSSYRKKLLKSLKRCPITLITDKRLLIASHIKPWYLSNNLEKVDIYNGLILSPLYDKLFDEGLITFSTDKCLHISSSVSRETILKLNLQEKIYNELPIEGREKYLEFHNKNVFIE